MKSAGIVAAAVVLVVVASPAAARRAPRRAPATEPATGSGATDAPPPAGDVDWEIARQHFNKGLDWYERGDYPQALVEFLAAQRVKPMPAFYFNIARCHDRMEHLQEAIDSYQVYLALVPGAADEGEVRARIDLLRQRLALPPLRTPADRPALPAASLAEAALVTGPTGTPGGAVGPASVEKAAESATDTAARPSLAPAIAVGAVALAAAVSGAALVGSVAPDFSRLSAMCNHDCPASLVEEPQRRANAGYGLLAVAGAAAITDGILWYLALRDRRPPTALRVIPSGLGAALVTSF